jgi:tetraprenyl-beta-curcumene synthase
LHQALVDALDPGSPTTDYYQHGPRCDDSGYLNTLVAACRAHYQRLPSSPAIHWPVIREATRGQVCAINHHLHAPQRDAMLHAWATNEFPDGHEAQWFELTAAASTNLTVFALLALASEPRCCPQSVEQTAAAYFPWISVMTAMLDSYVDQDEDAQSASHNYLTHYPTSELATRRICELIRRCVREANALADGKKHAVIAGCMFAMYLSKNTALTPLTYPTTTRLINAGGSLTRLLHPILRLWRTAYGLRSA